MKNIKKIAKEFQEYSENCYGKKRREAQARGNRRTKRTLALKKIFAAPITDSTKGYL